MGEFSKNQKEYLKTLITDLNKSIKEDIADLEIRLDRKLQDFKVDCGEKVKILENRVKELEKQNKDLSKEIVLLQKNERKNNIVIHGLNPESEGINIEDHVRRVIVGRMNLQLNETDLSDVYRLGKGEKGPVIVEFRSKAKRTEILKKSASLKGTNIFVSQDLIPEEREKQKILVNYMKDYRKKGRKAIIKGGNLIVDGEVCSLERLKKLQIGEGSGLGGGSVPDSFTTSNRPKTRSTSK